MGLPASVQQHAALAAHRPVQAGPAQVRPHDLQRHPGVAMADVRDVPMRKRGAAFRAHVLLDRIGPKNVLFE